MSPSIATSTARSIDISIVDVAATASRSNPVDFGFVFGVVFSFGFHANLPDEAEQLTANRRHYLRFVLSLIEQRSVV